MRKSRLWMIVFCMVFGVLSGCNSDGDAIGGDDNPDGDVDLEESEEEPAPDMPRALCGMPAYDLLPREEVGQTLSFEKDTLYDMTAEELSGMLDMVPDELADLLDFHYGVRLYRYSYTTQDKGQPVTASSFLAFPANSGVQKGQTFPLAMVFHGTTGYSDSCAPTHPDNFLEGPAYAAIIAAQGYIVVAPDYIGLNGFGEASTTPHGYTVGEQLAVGNWDALRAGEELFAKNEFADEAKPDGNIVMWGASQGGFAALFTELYGPYYAPEYEVAGIVADVPPIVLKPLAVIGVEVSGAPSVGLGGMLVTNRAWYGAPEDLHETFTNEEPYFFADNLEENIYYDGVCGEQPNKPSGDFDLRTMYTDDFREKVSAEDWDAVEPWSCYLTENSIVETSVQPLRYTPTLLVLSELDELVITEPMREGYDRLCENENQMWEYLECKNANHASGALWSLPEQFDWLKERLAGVPVDPGKICKRTDPVCCSGTPADQCEDIAEK